MVASAFWCGRLGNLRRRHRGDSCNFRRRSNGWCDLGGSGSAPSQWRSGSGSGRRFHPLRCSTVDRATVWPCDRSVRAGAGRSDPSRVKTTLRPTLRRRNLAETGIPERAGLRVATLAPVSGSSRMTRPACAIAVARTPLPLPSSPQPRFQRRTAQCAGPPRSGGE